MKKVHYGDATYTQCRKYDQAYLLPTTTDIDQVTCKTCLAAIGNIMHPSAGRRNHYRKPRKPLC